MSATRIGWWVLLLAMQPQATRAICPGDCLGDGAVTVEEIVTLVNIALGNGGAAACTAGDTNQDGDITVDEIITAVNGALHGCPPTPTPTNTAAPTGTPTPVPPPTSTPSFLLTPTLTPTAGLCELGATGQLVSYPGDKNDGIAGPVPVPDDGATGSGLSPTFIDNGDGTITHIETGLMWEAKDDSGGLHDVNATFVWSGDGSQETVWDWLTDVNADGGVGFAGHTDWRIPNVNELQTLVNYGTFDPSVFPPFDVGCERRCRLPGCSCTAAAFYWSSTTLTDLGSGVVFIDGVDGGSSKHVQGYARAVRAGRATDATCLPATGQTRSYAADRNDGVTGPVTVSDDGALQLGRPPRFRDNGDGTVTDQNTGLMWEKKDRAGGLHDQANVYRWSGNGEQETIWDWLDDVNSEIDPVFGDTGFAGYTDWRIPNVNELRSVLVLDQPSPTIAPAFVMGCTAGCSVASCSCTAAELYWSATTLARNPAAARWLVSFGGGGSGHSDLVSDSVFRVRAVRPAVDAQ